MYEVDDLFEGIRGFEPGTSILVTGSSATARSVSLDIIARGYEDDEGTIIIATDRSARTFIDALRERSSSFDPSLLGIVDTTGQDDETSSATVEYLNSAGDLTGISLGTAKLVRRLSGEQRPIRLGLISISTLLMYVDLQTVFRFLHVFTSRVNSGGWLGVFALDPEMHDEQTVSTIRAAFDVEIVVGPDDSTVRGNGILTA